MTQTTVHEQVRALDQFNPLVPLALGLLSSFEGLDAALASAPEVSELPATADAEADRILLVMLGLLALREKLRRWLEDACPEVSEDSAPAETAVLAAQGWLR